MRTGWARTHDVHRAGSCRKGWCCALQTLGFAMRCKKQRRAAKSTVNTEWARQWLGLEGSGIRFLLSVWPFPHTWPHD